jgi:hypothetical protein
MQCTVFGIVMLQSPQAEAHRIIGTSNFEISAPQCSTHCTPHGRGDVLDIVVHHNARLSEFIVTNILDSDHLQINPVRRREPLDPAEKLADWELFQSLTSELLSPVVQIYLQKKLIKQHVTLQLI